MPICQSCVSDVQPGSRFCGRCGSALPQVIAPQIATYPAMMARPDLEGISGWLIFLAVALVIAPIIATRTILRTDLPLVFGKAPVIGSIILLKNLISLAALIVMNCL